MMTRLSGYLAWSVSRQRPRVCVGRRMPQAGGQRRDPEALADIERRGARVLH